MNRSTTVDEALAQRVREVAAAMNYRPSQTARALALGGSQTVAILVPDIASPGSEEFFAAMSRRASDEGYGILIAPLAGDDAAQRARISEVRSRCDAVVLYRPSMSDEALRQVITQVSALTLVDRPMHESPVAQVYADHAYNARLVIDHLWDSGHRRLLAVHGFGDAADQVLLRELKTAVCRHSGMHLQVKTYHRNSPPDVHLLTAAITDGTSAILATTGDIGVMVMSELGERNPSALAAISVISMDDLASARYAQPSLISIDSLREPLTAETYRRVRAHLVGAQHAPAIPLRGRLRQRPDL